MQKKNFTPTILLLVLINLTTFSQNLLNSTLYTVSTEGNDMLHRYDFLTEIWSVIGETGTENLNALEFDNFSKTLYGVDEGKLGTINVETGVFTGFGVVNTGEGAYGPLLLDDIQDLAFDMHHNILYAVHRVPGNGPGTNDVIFKINPTTGLIIKNELHDHTNNLVDYVTIDEIFNTENLDFLYDLSGISFDPYASRFFAIHTQKDNSATQNNHEAVISEIEIDSDMILLSSIVYDTPLSNIQDLCYGGNDEFYTIESTRNQFIDFDQVQAINIHDDSSFPKGKIEPVGTINNFKSLACSYPINDLALTTTVSNNQPLPITENDVVTYQIIVHNQGELTVDEINLVSYISNDAEIQDSNWEVIDNKAYLKISKTLPPGDSLLTTLQTKIKNEFEGETTIAAEIISVFSNSITDVEGNPISLPDIDSFYNDIDDETNSIDNSIDGRGMKFDEDEDDHDIATVKVKLSDCSCYSVAVNTNYENELFKYNTNEGTWTNVGKTGTTAIKALTYVQSNKTLYGIEKGKLGTINVVNGQYTSFGTVNSGEGVYGTLVLNDIEGLAYDTENEVLFAVHRIPGDGPGTNDVLFKIDPTTGKIIKEGFPGIIEDQLVDYAIIPEILLNENLLEDTYDVQGLTYNPYTHQLIAIQTKENANQTILTEIDKTYGYLEQILFNEQSQILAGISFAKGNEYSLVGSDSEGLERLSSYNLLSGNKSHPKIIDPTGISTNFQSLACQTPVNDLALKVTLSPHHDKPITEEVDVTFDITVYNQGEIEINEFILAGVISENMSINDLDDGIWKRSNNGIFAVFNQSILPGETFTTTIDGEVDEGFSGNMTNSFEIAQVFSNDFIDLTGNFIPLADVDSRYDYDNNETNIVDDQIDGNGLHKNEDEDDHDIVTVKVGLPDCSCYSVAHNNGNENELYQFDAEEGTWSAIGKTGTTALKALTYIQSTQSLLGIEQGKLGSININNGQFTHFGEVNTGQGNYGNLILDDIVGLTYDTRQEIMFAVHRVPGDGPGTNDVLFKIDPKTGLILKNAFLKDAYGNFNDYAIIDEVYLNENIYERTYDVTGIAYDIDNDRLIALHTKDNANQTIITDLNKNFGNIDSELYDDHSNELKSITSTESNQYFSINFHHNYFNKLVSYDFSTGNYHEFGNISPSSQSFQGLACRQSICVDEKNISETNAGQGEITSGTYQAGNFINSDGIINGNQQNVTYKAGIEINLEPGFEVEQGSNFFADIEDCQ